jgi:uncharacterized protein YjbJ (UPF0337 family)
MGLTCPVAASFETTGRQGTPQTFPVSQTEEFHMGVFEEAKGKAKEAVGDLTNNPDLQREGQAQKDKGEAEREATQARAEAKGHDAKAKAHEMEQEAAEDAK